MLPCVFLVLEYSLNFFLNQFFMYEIQDYSYVYVEFANAY